MLHTDRIAEAIAARRAREDAAAGPYLVGYLRGLEAYGRAELLNARDAPQADVALAEVDVAEQRRRARAATEHTDVDPERRYAGHGWLAGYDAAQAAYVAEVRSAGWVRHVD